MDDQFYESSGDGISPNSPSPAPAPFNPPASHFNNNDQQSSGGSGFGTNLSSPFGGPTYSSGFSFGGSASGSTGAFGTVNQTQSAFGSLRPSQPPPPDITIEKHRLEDNRFVSENIPFLIEDHDYLYSLFTLSYEKERNQTVATTKRKLVHPKDLKEGIQALVRAANRGNESDIETQLRRIGHVLNVLFNAGIVDQLSASDNITHQNSWMLSTSIDDSIDVKISPYGENVLEILLQHRPSTTISGHTVTIANILDRRIQLFQVLSSLMTSLGESSSIVNSLSSPLFAYIISSTPRSQGLAFDSPAPSSRLSPLESYFTHAQLWQLFEKGSVSTPSPENAVAVLDTLRLIVKEDLIRPLLLGVVSSTTTVISADVVLQTLSTIPSCSARLVNIYGFGDSVNRRYLLTRSIQAIFDKVYKSYRASGTGSGNLLTLGTDSLSVLHDMMMSIVVKSLQHKSPNSTGKAMTLRSFGTLPSISGTGPLQCELWTNDPTGDVQDSLHIIDVDDIDHGLQSIMLPPSKLLEFAQKEGTKVVAQFSDGFLDWLSLTTVSPLVLYAIITQNEKLHQHRGLTIEALLYLTGVLDFLFSEICELTIQMALSGSTVTIVSPRQVMMMLAGDDELRVAFPGVIRGSGRLPISTSAGQGSPTAPIFDVVSIYRLCRDLISEQSVTPQEGILFSTESIQLIQTITEEFIMDLLWKVQGWVKSNNTTISEAAVTAVRKSLLASEEL